MKKSYLVVLGLSLMASVSAMASSVKVVASCTPEYPRPDQGYDVVVKAIFGTPYFGHLPRGYEADVTALTIAGPRALESYKVRYRSANPHRPGSSASYEGERFKLHFFTDGRPRTDHRVPARMEGRTKAGMDYSEKLLCKVSSVH
jgi:hypothetical protein